MDPHNIAMEGFFVLGERSRNKVDKDFIQSTIEKVFNVKLDIEAIYETYFTENL
jgi:midasin (ATPase involved in ribosome maturation)